jgi:membrane protease YdiL (CAAX protease family)
MNDQPVLLVLLIVAGLYAMNLWRQDYRAQLAGQAHPRAMPGATPAPLRASLIAAAGALLLLTAETWGEIRLGLSEQQSKITGLFAAYTLIAAFLEELMFRGFIVVEGRGKALRWAGVVGASVVFAALHPFLWQWEADAFSWTLTAKGWFAAPLKVIDGLIAAFSWTLTAKGWFSTAVVFASSLWFYTVRFAGFNPQGSLIPCIVAHATKNLGVIIIKGASGFVVGWW